MHDGRRVTSRLTHWIAVEGAKRDFLSIARECGLSGQTVVTLFGAATEVAGVGSDVPRLLGLAVVSLAGQPRPVMLDLSNASVIDVYRSMAALEDQLRQWSKSPPAVKHIWFPLAKSNGKILELVRLLKAKDGDRQKKLHQFLNEVGARALGRHIGRVQEIAETSASAMEYEIRVNRRFGEQRELDFVTPPNIVLPATAPRSPANGQQDMFADFDAQLAKEAAN